MTSGLEMMRETARDLTRIVEMLKVHKASPLDCLDCRGQVTFGCLMECPLAWHSDPWCKEFRRLPSTTAAVIGLHQRMTGGRQ